MVNSDYTNKVWENFKTQGNNYQLQYDSLLNHLKEFYEAKCKAIDFIKNVKNTLITTDTSVHPYTSIIYKIDSTCILFKIEKENLKLEKDAALETTTSLAIKTSLDNKSLRDLPFIPANCVALAYILQKETLRRQKKGTSNSISGTYLLGGKLIGKLFLGMLGPASLIITGLSFLNKTMKEDAKTMETTMEIDVITNKLVDQVDTLKKMDLKLCCLKEELCTSLDNLKYNSSDLLNIDILTKELDKVCDLLHEKI